MGRTIIIGLVLLLVVVSSGCVDEDQTLETGEEMKVNFYILADKLTNEKGEFVGTVEYKNGKVIINVTDLKLENILKSDFIGLGGKTEEITLPSGEKVLRGGVKKYEAGTLEHLQYVINHSYSLGYVAEIVE